MDGWILVVTEGILIVKNLTMASGDLIWFAKLIDFIILVCKDVYHCQQVQFATQHTRDSHLVRENFIS